MSSEVGDVSGGSNEDRLWVVRDSLTAIQIVILTIAIVVPPSILWVFGGSISILVSAICCAMTSISCVGILKVNAEGYQIQNAKMFATMYLIVCPVLFSSTLIYMVASSRLF